MLLPHPDTDWLKVQVGAGSTATLALNRWHAAAEMLLPMGTIFSGKVLHARPDSACQLKRNGEQNY